MQSEQVLRSPLSAGASVSRLIHNPWVTFIARRLVSLVAILIVLMTLTFLMVRLVPGDPAVAVGGTNATADELTDIRHRLGVDEPMLSQFRTYVGDVLSLDFGQSFVTETDVSTIIGDRIGLSAKLAALSLTAVMVFSVPFGMLAALLTRNNRHPRFEIGFTATTSVLGTFPEFLLATLLAA